MRGQLIGEYIRYLYLQYRINFSLEQNWWTEYRTFVEQLTVGNGILYIFA